MSKVLVLVGFSACGKDTVKSLLEHRGYKSLVSHTTRPMRNNEVEGKEYYFINKSTYNRMKKNKEFTSSCRTYKAYLGGTKKLKTYYYALSKKELDNQFNKVVVLDLGGAEALKKDLGNDMITVFIDTPENVRKGRCMNRGDFKEKEWERRAEDDRKIFAKINESKVIDLLVESSDSNYTFRVINQFMNRMG